MAPGNKLGAYEVTGLLGKGGMGDVYRARDVRLHREVALKVLPASLAVDAAFRARFEREAQVLASLNHPNIASIYGLEENAIVMELVEGETLKGPLPVKDALAIARQIAEALEAAHERGIVHRDLKPGNVKVTPEGMVKVLDFGLAKAPEKQSTLSPADSPTLTLRATEDGLILGTAAYMSPEQAAGKTVDRRADIWAFGVVIYELLTGRRLFDAEGVSETLADVLRKDIDLLTLPRDTPPAIGNLLRRCLDRNLKTRLQHIGEARIAIDNAYATPVAPSPSKQPWPWVVAAFFALAFAALALIHFSQAPPKAPGLRAFSFTPGGIGRVGYKRAVIAPDGRHIAYVAENKLWIRPIDSENVRAIDGTTGASVPFWSPDSSQVGFAADGELRTVPLAGGAPFTISKLDDDLDCASWSPDGRTILAAVSGTLLEFPAEGGSSRTVAARASVGYLGLSYSPSRNSKRLAVASIGTIASHRLFLIDLNTGHKEELTPFGANPVWSAPAYVLYQTRVDAAGLWLQRVSPETGKAIGTPMPVLNEGSDFSLSTDGTLVWVDSPYGARQSLVWRDASGKHLGDAGVAPGFNIDGLAISPDGKRVAFQALDNGNLDIYIADLTGKSQMRLTFGREAETTPLWSPTGTEIVYSSHRNDNSDVMVRAASGAGEPRPVLVRTEHDVPQSWSSDGTALLGFTRRAATGQDLWMIKRDSNGTFGEPIMWLATPTDERLAAFSPDGRYIAFVSSHTGRNEIFARTTGGSGQWQVGRADPVQPRWGPRGHEIFYLQGDRLMVAPVDTSGDTLRPRTPAALFQLQNRASGRRTFDVHPDGKRFLFVEQIGDRPSTAIHVLENWSAVLRQKGLQ